MANIPHFVTLGMFIIDEFSFMDENGQPAEKTVPMQGSQLAGDNIGGGGTYAVIGARIWLPPHKVGMIVDRGNDFPQDIQDKLLSYGSDMWHFRDRDDRGTTRALNLYRGDHRGFQYLTPRIQLAPRDLNGTRFAWPAVLHFICSPTRALQIISEVAQVDERRPVTIFEPIPMHSGGVVLSDGGTSLDLSAKAAVDSPNAEEALSLLSISPPVTRESVEAAAARFLQLGVQNTGPDCVIIRSGALGAFVQTRVDGGRWVDAYWTPRDSDHVIDVTGAGNSFLGGLAAGLLFTGGDFYEATLYATISASFIIEQNGLPILRVQPDTGIEEWNSDIPQRRVDALRRRHLDKIQNKDH